MEDEKPVSRVDLIPESPRLDLPRETPSFDVPALHSPLPWRVTYGELLAPIVSDAYGHVAILHPRTWNEARANAKLIVRAVNAHDALVAAVKHFLDQIEYDKFYAGRTYAPSDYDIVEILVAQPDLVALADALARAETT